MAASSYGQSLESLGQERVEEVDLVERTSGAEHRLVPLCGHVTPCWHHATQIASTLKRQTPSSQPFFEDTFSAGSSWIPVPATLSDR